MGNWAGRYIRVRSPKDPSDKRTPQERFTPKKPSLGEIKARVRKRGKELK